MRLGISCRVKHETPDEWAAILRAWGCAAVVFPCDFRASDGTIAAYVQACRDHDLTIAEVGAWSNPLHADPGERARNLEFCRGQLRLADQIAARCCVNIAGTRGEIWDGGYAENYADDTRRAIVETTRDIIDAVNPKNTFYTLEPMPWMLPDGPESYRALLEDVDRPAFAVHMDVVNMISCPQRYFFNATFMDECFRLLGPHVKSCHVKDMRLERFLTFNVKEAPCGDGNLDLVHYAALASATDPDMPFIIEHLKGESEYAASLRRVRTILGDASD